MLRKQSDETDPADWFYLGADRLKIADLAWKHEGLTASGLELLQEAVERYLKGFLIAKGWKLIKTHDLVTLIAEAAKSDSRFDNYRRFAQEPTDDFFAQHIRARIGKVLVRIIQFFARKQMKSLI